MIKCNICDKEFENARQLGGHKVNSHSTKICEICGKETASRGYSRHIAAHNNEQKDVALNKCKKCGNEFYNKPHKTKNFCSQKCANSRMWSEETKAKFRLKTHIKKLKELKCNYCSVLFYHNKNRKYCSKECNKKGSSRNISIACKGKTGGFREKGGRGKQGWFKNYYYQSTWELAYIIYNIDNDILFSRNTKEKFKYEYNGKTYNYYPDFKLENSVYVEIKGYYTPKVEEKLKSFPKEKKLIVIDKRNISKYLKYVESKYGKDYISGCVRNGQGAGLPNQ